MTSQRKAQANRSNALRSTGPRSAAGRSISAQNAKRHGLSVALPQELVGPKVQEVAELICEDGLDAHTAHELASRIVDYERNLAHERSTFAQNPIEKNAIAQTLERTAGQAGLGVELDMLTEMLSDPEIDANDREGIKLYKQVQIFIAHTDIRRAKEDSLTSVRYYRRATNQLIKFLKAIR